MTPQIFKDNGFIIDDSIGIYHPKYYNIRFLQLIVKDKLIDSFVVTVNEELQLSGNDAIEINSLEKLKSFYQGINIDDIWK